jgi:hypothetical protein
MIKKLLKGLLKEVKNIINMVKVACKDMEYCQKKIQEDMAVTDIWNND